MKPSEYSLVHEKRNRFVAIDGHDVPEIERIVSRTLDYIVVEKMHVPSHVPDALHATSVDNVS
jgi:hypothetical protein